MATTNSFTNLRVAGTSYVLMDSPRTINCPSGGGRLAAEAEPIDKLLIYPNPAGNDVTLMFALGLNEVADLTITDLTGRAVYTSRLVGKGVVHQEPVSLRNHPAGTYVARVVSRKRTLSGKIVVSR